MEQARHITRFGHDRAAADAPPLTPHDASFVDALLDLPRTEQADPVDRAIMQRRQLALARKLRHLLDAPG